MAEAINKGTWGEIAVAVDDTAIAVTVPQKFKGNIVSLLAQIEVIDVKVDRPAKVVINERTGTVVMGASVSIEAVAIAHGGLTIEVKSQNTASQPNPLTTTGQTTQTQNSQVTATEESNSLQLISGATIGDLVNALNKLGVKPRDLVQILIAIREAGALHAELEIL